MIPTDSPLVNALSPYSDAEQLTSKIVTYSFADSGVTVNIGDTAFVEGTSVAWSPTEITFAQGIFNYISTVTDLVFLEISSTGAALDLVKVDDLLGDTIGYSLFTEPGVSTIVIESAYIGPIADGTDNATLIHEIGHSIGLSHPFDGPATLPGVTQSTDPGDFGLNSELTTRMSYTPGTDPAYPNLDIRGESATFGALDIAALQLLYGENEETGLGDTVYGDDFDLNTIWDVGGTDAIDYSETIHDVVIDLRAATLEAEAGGGGYLSFIERGAGSLALGGYTIAFGVEIENALGGSGDDMLTGNAIGNMLTGGAGNDVLDGGAGLDTGVYSGNQSSYTLSLSAQATTLTDRRGEGDGTDTLVAIEALAFGDSAEAPFNLAQFGGAQMLSEAQMESFVELYVAYFNRAPDALGLNFWGTAFANGLTLEEMASLFIDQDETRATYDAGLSNADFATAVYANVLGRQVDQAGFDFWVGTLNDGSVGRDQFILAVLEGAKAPPPPDADEDFLIQQAADQQYLSTKTDIGAYYAVIKGLSNVTDAAAAMALFDGSATGISNAVAAIDGYHTAALDATNGAFLMPLVGVLDDPFALV